MNCSLTVLTCGQNATGLSAMMSIERQLSNESTILSRCLINVGDTTQRFCGENRIKLSRVCCIVITSLAPHNVSGLPGILLSLSSLVRERYVQIFIHYLSCCNPVDGHGCVRYVCICTYVNMCMYIHIWKDA